MKIDDLPFGTVDWSQVESPRTPASRGEARWRTRQFGEVRVRMLEYSPGYVADHWCSKGHFLLCLEGELETELADGRRFTLTPGHELPGRGRRRAAPFRRRAPERSSMSSTDDASRTGYEISTDPARLDIDAMHAYLTRSYWSPGIPLRHRRARRAQFAVLRPVRDAPAASRSVSRAWSPITPPSPIYATSTCSRSTAAAGWASA